MAIHWPRPTGAQWGGVALSGLAGAAQAVSLATPWSGEPLWWLQLVSLAVLAGLLHRASRAREALAVGWIFATAWLAGTFWWLFISMHTYGGLPAPLAVLAVLALAAFLGSYYALISALYWHLALTGKARAAIVFAALWLLAELARGTWWTGFPWGASGYAHGSGPLAPLARWVGVYGLSAVAAALALWMAQWRVHHARSLRAWGLVVAWVALCAAAQVHREQVLAQDGSQGGAPSDAPPLQIALLQGNIPQDEKFQPGSGVPLALQWYADQLRNTRATLVVAPETAIPLLPQQLLPGYLEGLQARFTSADGTRAALIGMPWGDDLRGYTNTVLGWAPGQTASYRYDKHHLVPFGEFIPPWFKWFTSLMNIPLGDFERGGVGQPSFAWAGQRWAPNICYEDLFGEELAARFADPDQAPTVLVNLSNIGWFGNTLAIDQHLQISRMRALELERPMVRATNTGATAIIDHRGVVTHQLERHTRGVLLGEVRGRGAAGEPVTPFARWASAWGLAPLWLLGLAGLAWGAVGVRRRRQRRQRDDRSWD